MKTFFYLVIGAVVGLLVAACDQDPLGLSYRQIAGDFYLHRWEDGKTYYIEEKGRKNQNGGGVIGGIAVQLGWNNGYIFAKRLSTFGGDPDGWMVLDVSKKTLEGPLSDEALNNFPEAKGVKFFDAEKAWRELD